MSSDRCILSVKYVPAASAGRLGGFLRYVQFRDEHADVDRNLSSLTRYVAHRDRTAPGGRLFGPRGNSGDLERRALLAHISRSIRYGDAGKHPRAAYRMVLSPECAAGLDLKALTRAAMEQLGHECGGTPPWIAAIHRNTKHPHVHIVMAARREAEPGRFKTVVINRERLGRMKLALGRELVRQREGGPAKLRLIDFGLEAPAERQASNRVPSRTVGLVVSAAQVVDSALRALAAQQRRELRRWLAEEERRLRERETHQRKHAELWLER